AARLPPSLPSPPQPPPPPPPPRCCGSPRSPWTRSSCCRRRPRASRSRRLRRTRLSQWPPAAPRHLSIPEEGESHCRQATAGVVKPAPRSAFLPNDRKARAVSEVNATPLPRCRKDASRAFATGDFTNTGLVDDVSGLSPSEILTIQNWLSFYSENYIFVGKLVGRFYDENGAPTKALEQAKAVIEEALKFKEQNNEKKQFPSCNSEWSSASGSRFWCSKQSGGVNRDWIGVPRKLYKPSSSDSHCVCVRTTGPPSGQLDSTEHSDRGDLDNPNLQEYKGCHPLADWCVLKD
uniref:Cytochrome b5 domain containing 2 n=1 Tax=Chelonoidis abingdonii TaxID=106734 RepID=A0A8C0GVB2_CHEAB